MDAQAAVLAYIQEKDEELSFIAKEIWDHPQVALQETYASRLLANKLEDDGFSIRWGAGGMPTAFIAEWGEGAPIIGFLGEYDALPGLSQALSSEKKPLDAGGPRARLRPQSIRHGLHGFRHGAEDGDGARRHPGADPLLWLPG